MFQGAALHSWRKYGFGASASYAEWPTVAGAVFAFDDPQGAALTQVHPGQDVEVHVNAGLNVGLTGGEIVEVTLHCIPFPRVLDAVFVAKRVFEKR